jgi:hypothetical protein
VLGRYTTGPSSRRLSIRADCLLAGVLGLEPRLTGPEPVGLPITPYPNDAQPPARRRPTLPERWRATQTRPIALHIEGQAASMSSRKRCSSADDGGLTWSIVRSPRSPAGEARSLAAAVPTTTAAVNRIVGTAASRLDKATDNSRGVRQLIVVSTSSTTGRTWSRQARPPWSWTRERSGQLWGWVMLTIQGMPNWSVHMPNSSPHACFSSGILTAPELDSWSQ